MAKSEFTLAFNEITEAHHLPRDVVIEALKQALVSAYRRDSGPSPAQQVEAEVDPVTNRYRILVEKEVVDSVMNKQTEISLEEARQINPAAQLGDTILAPAETNTKSFGRIAAQTAKQVILQKIREAERRTLYDEYKEREGDLVTGQVQSVSGQNVTLSLGRAEAIMPASHQIKGERYRPHDKVRTVIVEVRDSTRGPQIVVSRGHKNMLRRLLEYEVPEIYNGQVEIKSIAREPGQRSKVAVAALQPGVDPVGACVGMRGVRIQSIVKELNEEKIDVIEWNSDPAVFIAKALSPARVTGVYLEDDITQGNTATVIVPDDQLSLAIGREGQNARLAAKLTGWRIDIKSLSEAANSALNGLGEPPLSRLAEEQPDLVAEARRIMDKKKADRSVTPEEYHTLSRFVQMAEQRLLEQREASHARRRKALDKARASVPRHAFQMELEELELEADILQALKNGNINNVGELMAYLQAEENALRAMLLAAKAGDDAMEAIQAAIVSLVQEKPGKQPSAAAEASRATDDADVSALEARPTARAESEAVAANAADAAIDLALGTEATSPEGEDVPPAFPDLPVSAPVVRAPVQPLARRPAGLRPMPAGASGGPAKPTAKPAAKPIDMSQVDLDAYDKIRDESGSEKGGKKKGKGKAAGRELIFDEDRGQVVARRKRKGGRNRESWDDEDE